MSPEVSREGIALPDRYIAVAAAGIESLLEQQLEDGRFPSPPGYVPFHPADQQAIYPLTFLYATEHALNPYHGDTRLLEAALRLGDFLVANSEEDGKMHNNWNGHDVHMVDQRLWGFWLESWVLLADALDPERSAAWRQRIEAGIDDIARRLHGWVDIEEEWHTRSFGTSPNHASLYGALVYRGGMVFDRAEWRELADAFMTRFLRLQDEDGCWPEYETPVISYATVTLCGIGLMYEYTERADMREAIERSLPFLLHAYHPDTSPMVVLDGRVQHHAKHRPWAHFAMSLTPEGRGLAEFQVPSVDLSAHAPESVGRLLQNYVYWHHGPSVPVPQTRETFAYRMKQPAGTRKRGPWTWGLQGIVKPENFESCFSMDRQQLLELFHTRTGLVLNGANCKECPEAASFVSTRTPDDFLPRSAALDAEVTRIKADYRTFGALLELECRSNDEFVVQASSVASSADDVIRFRLQPAAACGDSVTIDGDERDLGEDAWEAAEATSLAWGGVTLRFDRPARLWWPFIGYNSYAGNHTYRDLHAARLIAEMELTTDDPHASVRIEID